MFIKDLLMWRHYSVVLENSDITMRPWQRVAISDDLNLLSAYVIWNIMVLNIKTKVNKIAINKNILTSNCRRDDIKLETLISICRCNEIKLGTLTSICICNEIKLGTLTSSCRCDEIKLNTLTSSCRCDQFISLHLTIDISVSSFMSSRLQFEVNIFLFIAILFTFLLMFKTIMFHIT
jgi:hypothetical protein